MSLLVLLLVPFQLFPPASASLASHVGTALAAQALARGDTVPPYLAFPEPGLDDPAAYEGYQTRVYQDARGNAFQVYLKGRSEEHTSELQSRLHLVCRLLLEKKKNS